MTKLGAAILAVVGGTIPLISHAQANTCGTPSQVPVITYNSTGTITSCTNTTIGIDASQVTTGTLSNARLPQHSSSFSTVADAIYDAANDPTHGLSVTTTAGQPTLTVSRMIFSPADQNKTITVDGAGPGGLPLVAQISGYTSQTQVTLDTNAGTTLTAQPESVLYGTNNQSALQAWLNACGGTNACILDAGNYIVRPAPNTSAALSITSAGGVTVQGQGKQLSNLYLADPGYDGIDVVTSAAIFLDSFSELQYFPASGKPALLNLSPVSGKSNYSTTLSNLNLYGSSAAIVVSAYENLTISGVTANGYSNNGFYYNDGPPQGTCPHGSFKFSHNTFGAPIGNTSVISLSIQDTGVGQIDNNEITGGGIGIYVNPTCLTGDIFLSNNTIEDMPSGMTIARQTGGSIQTILVNSNDFGGTGMAFPISFGDSSNSPWLYDVTISGNMMFTGGTNCAGTGTAIHLMKAVQGASVSGNEVAGCGTGTNGLVIDTGVTGISAGNFYRSITNNVINNSAGWHDLDQGI